MTIDFTGQRFQTRQPCAIHNKHLPASHINELHHVWPLGKGGPDIAENRVIVCATGHNNIHDLLSHFITLAGKVPYSVLKQYSLEERRLAKLGWERIMRKAM